MEELNGKQVSDLIGRFLDGSAGPWEWDDFMHMHFTDSQLAEIQRRCAEVGHAFPPRFQSTYSDHRGLKVLRELQEKAATL